jgi:VIT1/CCC1 family predicted Fe2+/Mn2+ transporter
MTHLTRFSFGTTSAIVTSLAFIVGLSGSSKIAIILSLLVFAVADNISDSLGLHIFQESDLKQAKVLTVSTFSNFFTRLSLVLVFVLLVALLPIEYAAIASLIYGISLLSILSYLIAKERKSSPYLSIFAHIAIAILVIAISYLLRIWITDFFSNLR